MIILIQGTPGSGKSYEATVYHALRALKRGRKVITNLPLNPDAFAEIDPEFAHLIELRDDPDPDTPIFSHVEHFHSNWVGSDAETGKEIHPLFIVDECHRCLGIDIVNKEVADWFAMHRHKGCDVVLMTQNHNDVARAITNRVDHLVQVENLKRKGMNKVYVRRVYSDCGYRARLEGQSVRTYKSEYFKLYNSYTQGGSGLELGSSDIRKWYLEPRLLSVAAVLLVAVGFAVYGTTKMILSGSSPLTPKLNTPKYITPDSARSAKKVEQPPRSPKPPPPRIVIKGLEDLALLKYAGVLSSNEGNMFLFSRGDGEPLILSSIDLKNAGYTVTSVQYCRITLKNSVITQIISC